MYKNMFAAEKLRKSSQKNCLTTTEPCWIPQISNFIPHNNSGINTCYKIEDYDCMITIFKKIRLSVSTKCEKHCVETTYRVSKSQTPIPGAMLVRNIFIVMCC